MHFTTEMYCNIFEDTVDELSLALIPQRGFILLGYIRNNIYACFI